MTNSYRESLICYLSQIPNGNDELERLLDTGLLTRVEAAVMRMRISVEKLDQRLDEAIEKSDRAERKCIHEGLQPCAVN